MVATTVVGISFGQFAEDALGRRVADGLRCEQSYRSILDTYLLPRFATLDLGEFTRGQYRAFLAELRHLKGRRGRPLAARYIRNINRLLCSIFNDAVEDELLDHSPCVRGRRDLPKLVDADPAWRALAAYKRKEIVALISDPRIPELTRVAIALHGFTGPRSSMLGALMWNAYDPDPDPLGKLVYAWAYSTVDDVIRPPKTNVAQVAPVHATLAAILERWYLTGWKETFGRSPGPADLVVPCELTDGVTKPMRNDGLYQRLESACKKIGIRFRSPHCLRATFISLAQEDGAPRELIQAITHPSPTDVFRGYSRFSWPAICEAVAKLKITLP